MGALVVEHVERDLGARARDDVVGGAALELLLDHAQALQGDRGHRADMAGAAAVRALVGRAFQHAGADALARHLHQAEMRDAADLDAGAVVLEAILEAPLDRAVVALLVHVDEVDDDQPGEVAQPQLAGDFLGRLEVGLERGVLDVVLAGGAPGIDVDRHQRLGLVEHDVAARAQLHDRREHGVELALDAVPGEDRLAVLVGLHVLGMARHQHAHEVARVRDRPPRPRPRPRRCPCCRGRGSSA